MQKDYDGTGATDLALPPEVVAWVRETAGAPYVLNNPRLDDGVLWCDVFDASGAPVMDSLREGVPMRLELDPERLGEELEHFALIFGAFWRSLTGKNTRRETVLPQP